MPEPKDVTYTEDELKAEVEKAKEGILAELTSERSKRREFEGNLKELQTQFDELKAAQQKVDSEKEKTELEAKGKYDEALEQYKTETQDIIGKKDAMIDELKTEITRFKVDNEIIASASDAISPQQIVTLIKAGYKFNEKDDGTIEILDSKTNSPVLHKDTGKTVDIAGLTEMYLGENKHLVKAGSQGGAGSAASGAPGEKTIDDLIKAAAESGNQQEVIKLKSQKMTLAGQTQE